MGPAKRTARAAVQPNPSAFQRQAREHLWRFLHRRTPEGVGGPLKRLGFRLSVSETLSRSRLPPKTKTRVWRF